MSQTLTYTIGFRSDIGQQRSLNEVAVAVIDLPGTQAAFVVCDGMGGLRAGDVAAKEAVGTVTDVLTERFAAGVPADIETALREAFTRANDAVNSLHHPVAAGGEEEDAPTIRREATSAALMGTTCVAGVVVDDTLHIAHAGDSRGYLLRGGKLTPLTDDHSYVAERVRAGDITEAEARVSRFRNMITRAIGIDATVTPEVRREPLQAGDTILVCSDGLTTMLEDAEIQSLMNAAPTARAGAERAAAILVDAANKKGGNDNITVLLIRVRDADGGEPAITSGPGVVDIDAPRRRGGVSPGVAFALGILVVLAILAALIFLYPPLHRAVLGGGKEGAGTNGAPVPSGVASSPLSVDYAHLAYDAPKPFAPLFLARGDLLAWSRDGGLYFVRGSSGTVASLDKNGQPIHSVADVEVVGPLKEVPPTRLFMATDPQGNVYLSYTKNRVITKMSPEGKVLATLRGFDRPEAITVDDEGNIYVVDYSQIKILKAHPPQQNPSPTPGASASPAAIRPAAKAKK